MGAASAPPAAAAGAIRRQIEQLYATRRLIGDDGVVCELDTLSVTAERGAFIAGVCREYRPAATLEIGMAWGMSTLFMLEALAEIGSARPGCHAVIDPFQSKLFHNAALRAVREAGAGDLIDFYAEPSQIVLPRMVSAGRRFDLAFIDGDHRFEAAFIDFYFIDQLLKPGGIVIFDDLGMDGVFLTCAFAEKNHHYIPKQEYISTSLAQRWNRRRDARTGRYVRPAIRVYQKPLIGSVRDEFYVAPFFRDLVQFEGIPGVVSPRLVRNRLNHIGRVALLEGDRLTARRAFHRSLQAGRFQFGTWMRLLRTFLPVRLAVRMTGGKSRMRERIG
jgi:predicted O-methyltransferase YrrM